MAVLYKLNLSSSVILSKAKNLIAAQRAECISGKHSMYVMICFLFSVGVDALLSREFTVYS